MPGRCRLCTTNDIDSLVEDVAAAMWDRHRERELMGGWEQAGPYWQAAMHDFARATVDTLHADHSP